MPKYTVTIPVMFEAKVEANNAADATNAISQIVKVSNRWGRICFHGVNDLDWHPIVNHDPIVNAMADKNCITLNEIEIYAEVDAMPEEEIAAATA